MDAVVGISGSSPAYVYMMIEAMADAAVADGMPGRRPISLRPRRCWDLPRWYWRRVNIRVN